MRTLIAPAALVLLSGCFFPADRGQVLESRVDKLKTENEKLGTQLVETQAQLKDTTARLQEALDQLDKASRTTGANIGVKVDSTLQDVAALRGQVEAQQHKLAELEAKLAAAPVATASTAPPEPKKDEPRRPDDPKEYLKLADDTVRGGDVELARRLYTELMKKWPKDDSAGDAHFGLGETYFNEKKCREALYEYGKVIQDFPKVRSAPTAYLRSSDCFSTLKMGAEAKVALEELLKQYPKSDAAKTAKTKLAELSKKGGKK
ncbi:MAG: tetratricopeptide repeat protein [Myxococcales bacterium]|nr:tetratricopeptide repeat protein [Myxococcales bacterium]